eukprot:Polyplicarium_translucidae@DN3274_c18_g2_i3.p2
MRRLLWASQLWERDQGLPRAIHAPILDVQVGTTRFLAEFRSTAVLCPLVSHRVFDCAVEAWQVEIEDTAPRQSEGTATSCDNGEETRPLPPRGAVMRRADERGPVSGEPVSRPSQTTRSWIIGARFGKLGNA